MRTNVKEQAQPGVHEALEVVHIADVRGAEKAVLHVVQGTPQAVIPADEQNTLGLLSYGGQGDQADDEKRTE
jgi:hypothetical protein